MNTTEEEIVFTKFPVDVAPCDSTKNFMQDMSRDVFRANITKFTCLDNQNIFF